MDDNKEVPEEVIEETPEQEDVVEEVVEQEPEEVIEETPEEEEVIDLDKIEIETRKTDEAPIEYGEDVDQDDVKVIGGIVEKQTAGVKAQLQETRDRLDVDSFIAERPEFKKYRPIILKHMKHEAYSKIPVKNIASMVASGDLLKQGAKAEREAQAKADATKTKGSTARKAGGGATDWKKVPKDDFEAQKRKVLGQV